MPTVRLHMAKLCEGAELNASNRLTLYGIFLYIVSPTFPFEHPPVHCAVEVDLDREIGMRESVLSVRIKDPDGDVIQSVSTPAQRHGAGPFGYSVRIMATCQLPRLRIEKPGMHSIEVLCDETVVGSDILAVMQVDSDGKVIG